VKLRALSPVVVVCLPLVAFGLAGCGASKQQPAAASTKGSLISTRFKKYTVGEICSPKRDGAYMAAAALRCLDGRLVTMSSTGASMAHTYHAGELCGPSNADTYISERLMCVQGRLKKDDSR
jgi:hypothetical protein